MAPGVKGGQYKGVKNKALAEISVDSVEDCRMKCVKEMSRSLRGNKSAWVEPVPQYVDAAVEKIWRWNLWQKHVKMLRSKSWFESSTCKEKSNAAAFKSTSSGSIQVSKQTLHVQRFLTKKYSIKKWTLWVLTSTANGNALKAWIWPFRENKRCWKDIYIYLFFYWCIYLFEFECTLGQKGIQWIMTNVNRYVRGKQHTVVAGNVKDCKSGMAVLNILFLACTLGIYIL